MRFSLARARRLEELSLNASGAFQSLLYDGWLLGYRRGPTKRLRCVNPFPSLVQVVDFADLRAPALPAEARRCGALRAYLQVTAANAAAIALYARFGFRTAYDYWYRALPESP